MVFVKTNPPWAGRVKEIPEFVNDDLWDMIEKWRWWKMGSYEIKTAVDAIGIRAIQENI